MNCTLPLDNFYKEFLSNLGKARKVLNRPMTYAEKVLYAHLWDTDAGQGYAKGIYYALFAPDRVAMQDATAQMALLQFMTADRPSSAVPASIHCDHLILANQGAKPDIMVAEETNREVYGFLRSVAAKYGMDFWKPGAGIIHQTVLENYAFPGGMMLGTDSHTPNAGGLGMVAIGVGGADAVDVMTGQPWELLMPKLIGVHLKGALKNWSSQKDVILKIAGILTVKGGTNCIIEYFGEGAESLSATGKATICNMGAEVGATTSIFPYDAKMAAYLLSTGRGDVAKSAEAALDELKADPEVLAEPAKYFDRIIEIDLSELEQHVNGPFSPDIAHPVSSLAKDVEENGWPEKVDVVLIGSCTNSSLEDLYAVASVLEDATSKGLLPKTEIIINPGSSRIYKTISENGILKIFEHAGATVMTNACGPCIGQWKRHTDDPLKVNSIVTTFNRNFAKRADGNPNTHAFISSPVTAVATVYSGYLGFDPNKDSLTTADGREVRLELPKQLDIKGCTLVADPGAVLHHSVDPEAKVEIDPESDRIQELKPFDPPKANDFVNMPLLIKTSGKCTTDHISMAGPWLKYRGHLENISNNLLMGAVNAFNGKTDSVLNQLTGMHDRVSASARTYKKEDVGSFVVAEENYGEGSSREHAAMEPRYLNVKVILAKSFARIHETNLKKQGILALTFRNKDDYDSVKETDRLSILSLDALKPGQPLTVVLTHEDGKEELITANHTYNSQQIQWFKAGSALNYCRHEAAKASQG